MTSKTFQDNKLAIVSILNISAFVAFAVFYMNLLHSTVP